ncbi:MAG: methyltransferase [Gemmatimonadetes bacterium]|nr:methyltransferase [Gemmatimonadota bacterium]
MRIITGHLRGREIPSHRALSSIRLTSSRLKEAVFSMLGSGLEDQIFLDLCAGSGQIGLEACSRGAQVTFNEPDRRRYEQLRRLLRQLRAPRVDLHCAKGQMLIPRLCESGKRFDLIYLDPPYHATRSDQPLSLALLELLADGELLSPEGLLLIQHQSELELPPSIGNLLLLQRRPYGNTALAIYHLNPDPQPI